MPARNDSAAECREARDAEYGYREVSAKHLRLAEWSQKREREEFARLVNRLHARQWRLRIVSEGGARHAQLLAYKRGWYRQRRERDPEAFRAAERERRRAARKRDPIVCVCRECGSTWCRVPWVRGVVPQFCSTPCWQTWRYANDPVYRERVKAAARANYARRRTARGAA